MNWNGFNVVNYIVVTDFLDSIRSQAKYKLD